MPKLDLDSIEQINRTGYPSPWREQMAKRHYRRLAPAAGLTDFGAVDIMFAPVVTRFVTYSVPVPRFAMTYMEAILDHPWMKQWIDAAQEEPWVIERYETPVS